MDLRIECFQNEFLPLGGSVMNAVVTVTGGGPGAAAPPAPRDRAEVLIVDTSGSMTGRKLQEARNATDVALDQLPDGARFAVIAGTHTARMVYPSTVGLAVASPETRKAAHAAVRRLEADGGTAMSTWVDLAVQVFGQVPGVRHAILLTDGRNESDHKGRLAVQLQQAQGRFQCDCRGVGADWEVDDLRAIATALQGTYDIVAEPAGLADDFAAMMSDSLSRRTADVALRVWTPMGAELVTIKQMEPQQIDLTGTRVPVNALTGDYPTGAWGAESRDYYLGVRLPTGEVGAEMLAARVTLRVGDDSVGQVLVKAVWTDDLARSTRVNRRVAEVMGQTEFAQALQDGVEALRGGDTSRATDRFGQAARLAAASGNQDGLDLVARAVDIEDAATGRVRPKARVDEMDMMIVETRSTRTTRTPR